jgi:hypothetical protein
MEKLKDPAMLLSIANSIGLVGTTAYFYKQIEAIRSDMVKISQTLTGVLRKITEMEKGEQNKSEVLHTLTDQIRHINEEINALPLPGTIDNMDLDLTEILAVLEEHDIIVDRPSQASYGRRSGDRRTPRKNLDNVPYRDRNLYRSTAPTPAKNLQQRNDPWPETDTDRSSASKPDPLSRNDTVHDTDPRPRQPQIREPQIRETPMRETPMREPPMRETPMRETPMREPSMRETPMREPQMRESRVHNDGYQSSRREMRPDPGTGYDDDSDLIGEVRRQQDRT